MYSKCSPRSLTIGTNVKYKQKREECKTRTALHEKLNQIKSASHTLREQETEGQRTTHHQQARPA